MGTSFSESKAIPDPKLSPFLDPSPPGLVEIAPLPFGLMAPQHWASLLRMGPRKALGEGPKTKPGPRPGCTVLGFAPALTMGSANTPVPSTESLHPKPLALGRGEGTTCIFPPRGAFSYVHFPFATIFSWGLIKDLEPFTACGWLFIWVFGNYLPP